MNHTHNILIIDDNPDDREHCVRSLKKVADATYRCLEASDGIKGIETINTRLFDCVLLDYSLPGMNGLEVLKKIRQEHPLLPIILMTGQGNEAVAVEAIKEGAHDYLTKSAINPERLHHTIMSALHQSLLKCQMAEKDIEIQEKTEALERMVGDLEAAKCEQERLIAKLTESNSELERFAYICSHDLQEPLRMITSFTERLQKYLGASLDERGQHYMKYIIDGAAHARLLVSDILNYARIDNESDMLANIESETILHMVMQDVSARVEESGARITHDVLPEVYMQPTHLRQLLQNLISNALKFATGTPHIHVAAAPSPEGAFWTFSVEDNGIGIASDQIHKIFIIFQRLHSRESYPGTGIGLALCKKIVQKYGGKIWVESEPGKGSIFFFTLPSANLQNEQAAA